jgi:hypothetical protein
MNWLELERLDRDLYLDRDQGLPQNSPRAVGTYAGRPLRLYGVDFHMGDEDSGGPKYGGAYRSPFAYDEGLRIEMTLDNPRPVGLRVHDHGSNSARPRLWWLRRWDEAQQFAARFHLVVWPPDFQIRLEAVFVRPELITGLLRMRRPVSVELSHKSVGLSTPYRLTPERFVPMIRLAFALAEAIEPALRLAA